MEREKWRVECQHSTLTDQSNVSPQFGQTLSRAVTVAPHFWQLNVNCAPQTAHMIASSLTAEPHSGQTA